MNNKIRFKMALSNDEDSEFEVDANIEENKISFLDINNVNNEIIVNGDEVIINRNSGTQVYKLGKTTSTEYKYDEGLILNIDTFTESFSYEKGNLELVFENYVNGNFTNKHVLTIQVLK